MTTEPTYLTLVAETGFDPATVTPISSRAEREVEFGDWLDSTLNGIFYATSDELAERRARTAEPKRRPRKAAARVAAEQDER